MWQYISLFLLGLALPTIINMLLQFGQIMGWWNAEQYQQQFNPIIEFAQALIPLGIMMFVIYMLMKMLE